MQDTGYTIFADDHVANIRKCYQEKQSGEWSLYDACAAANAAWSETAKPAKLKQLRELFTPAKFSMLAQIGADERLRDPRLRELLPPGYSIHHEVHMLNDDELRSFKHDLEENGRRRLRRADVKRFRRSHTQEPQHREVQLSDSFYAALKPHRELTDKEQQELNDELAGLASKYGSQVIFPPERALLGEYEKFQRCMRTLVKHFVRDQIKMRKAPGKYKGPHHLRKYGGFLEEEVKIESDADEDRMRKVLETLGSEDQFELIRKAATDLYPCEQTFKTPRWLEVVAGKRPPFAALAAEVAEIRAPPISSFGITEDMKRAFQDFK